MKDNQPHILNASSNLLGICFVIITGLHLTRHSDITIADEISLAAAFAFIMSCILSYLSMAGKHYVDVLEKIANYLFIVGMLSLFAATFIFAMGII